MTTIIYKGQEITEEQLEQLLDERMNETVEESIEELTNWEADNPPPSYKNKEEYMIWLKNHSDKINAFCAKWGKEAWTSIRLYTTAETRIKRLKADPPKNWKNNKGGQYC